MFFNKKKFEEARKDPNKALEQADKTINSGVTGFLTKTFMGKDFVDQTNQSLNTAKNAMGGNANLSMTGVPASAEVLSIEDTGKLVNYDPIVRLKLAVQPAYGTPFETTTEVLVSKIAIPRAGDKISIKYNPVNNTEVMIV
ncbi:MAG TPA: hypothetical protein VK004_06965 [Ignavibacteria bacterium]|nr:hypothetical protein [Ignavibacteria bacterium]